MPVSNIIQMHVVTLSNPKSYFTVKHQKSLLAQDSKPK
jgi:hypothetical protein